MRGLYRLNDTEGALFFFLAYLIDVILGLLLFVPYYVMECVNEDLSCESCKSAKGRVSQIFQIVLTNGGDLRAKPQTVFVDAL